MTDNFELYKDFIRKEGWIQENKTSDLVPFYYVIEIIKRGKDSNETAAANYHFKNYYFNSIEEISEKEGEIKKLCDCFGMRAYGSVNFKSYVQVMLDTMAEFARRIAEYDYKKPQAIFDSCSGKYFNKSDKKWVIDVDRLQNDDIVEKKNVVKERIESVGGKIIAEFPTKNGCHFITEPFFLSEEIRTTDLFDIKKNHLTLVYENV